MFVSIPKTILSREIPGARHVGKFFVKAHRVNRLIDLKHIVEYKYCGVKKHFIYAKSFVNKSKTEW